MRTRTAVALALVLLALGGVGVYAFTQATASGSLSERWVSDTARDVRVNHHVPAVANVDGHWMVFAPISGEDRTDQCGLVGLGEGNGSTRWVDGVPAANCTSHSVANPTVADFDGDGAAEVLAATTERAVVAVDPRSGEEEFRHELTSYGYTQPLVTDFTGDDTAEIVVVDVQGTVFVLESDGTEVWTKRLASYVWGEPEIADFDGDGASELVVGLGNGGVTMLEPDGSVGWNAGNAGSGAVSWMTTGRADDDSAREVVVATTRGDVAALDGATGAVEWSRNVGSYAAVHAFGDGDDDGTPEVYATAADGTLRSLDAATGDVEWRTALTGESVQMMPPPSTGDLDGDGVPELVAAGNDGRVSVVDPASGEVLASYERGVPIYTRAVLADADEDGRMEMFVMYGDGRVVSLSFEG